MLYFDQNLAFIYFIDYNILLELSGFLPENK